MMIFMLFWMWVLFTHPQRDQQPPFPLNLFAQAKTEDFIGEKECASCHRAQVESFERSAHAAYVHSPRLPIDKRGCEACHGPGNIHLEDERNPAKVMSFKKAPSAAVATACLRCHAETMHMTQWKRTSHAQHGIACTSCHQIHRSAEQRLPIEPNRLTAFPATAASLSFEQYMLKGDPVSLCSQCHQKEAAEFRMNFHHPLPEGRMICSDCHEVHPDQASGKRSHPQKGSCATCHADAAGPFTFAHDPVVGGTGEECGECHRPHGSNNPRLLKTFSRGLCAQCHTDKASTHNPGQTCWTAGCHVAVHGSNTDPLLRTP